LSPIQEALLFPQVLATSTSSIQQAGMDGDPNDLNAEQSVHGDHDRIEHWVEKVLAKYLESFRRETKEFTLFLPSNRAWWKRG